MKLNIGLLVIATGHYLQFLDGLLASARQFFFAQHKVTPFVFSDSAVVHPGTVHIRVAHEQWPLVTLKRYHYFVEHEHLLRSMDYLFYVDVDMRFVDICADELLPDTLERLVGVLHPSFYRANLWITSRILDFISRDRWSARPFPHGKLPFERDRRSLACIADKTYRRYYAGGFNGGFADSYLTMARSLRDAIDHDMAQGITAVWHDESHLNRYFHVQRPKSLPASYCYPESGFPNLRRLRPVIIALDKDHAYFRHYP